MAPVSPGAVPGRHRGSVKRHNQSKLESGSLDFQLDETQRCGSLRVQTVVGRCGVGYVPVFQYDGMSESSAPSTA